MLIYGKPTNQKLNHSISPQRCALDPGWKPTTKANTTKKLLATRKTWRRKRRIQHEKKKDGQPPWAKQCERRNSAITKEPYQINRPILKSQSPTPLFNLKKIQKNYLRYVERCLFAMLKLKRQRLTFLNVIYRNYRQMTRLSYVQMHPVPLSLFFVGTLAKGKTFSECARRVRLIF